MATIASASSNTITSLLATISTVATTSQNLIQTGASSIDMLDRYVQRAKDRQIKTHLVEDYSWQRNLLIEASKEQEKIETDLAKEYSSDNARKARFESIHSDLAALFNPENVQ